MIPTERIFEAIHRRIEKIGVFTLRARDANLFQCSKKGLWDSYFVSAEHSIDEQWKNIIWPLIKGFDFSTVLELSPGAGRNTEKLCTVSKKIYAVDFNEYALEKCRKRLSTSFQGCEIVYHKNNGVDLKMIQDSTISAVYCWDSAVHFDKSILRDYIYEFFRVLKVGGKGFIHHSNLGEKANKNIKKNPGWRSNMSKELFAEFCEQSRLSIVTQKDIPWGNIVDCATVFMK